MFTKNDLRIYRLEIEQALQSVAQKHNVEIKAGSISYSDNSFTCKLEVKQKEVDGQPFEQVEFEKCCILYGLTPEDYLRKFTSNGKTFEIYGFNHKAHKMPILARCLTDGKEYKFPTSTIKLKING